MKPVVTLAGGAATCLAVQEQRDEAYRAELADRARYLKASALLARTNEERAARLLAAELLEVEAGLALEPNTRISSVRPGEWRWELAS